MKINTNQPKITYKEKQKIFSMLNKISLFGGLTAGELEILMSLLTSTTFKKGDYIFKQGESPNNIYIIESGTVDIVKKYKDTNITLVEFDEGNLFGETELIGIFKYIASAVATTEVKVLVFSKSALYSLHSINIKLFSKIILNVAREACRRTAQTDDYWIKQMVELKEQK
jgi:CRP-like cAMP-binding protein